MTVLRSPNGTISVALENDNRIGTVRVGGDAVVAGIDVWPRRTDWGTPTLRAEGAWRISEGAAEARTSTVIDGTAISWTTRVACTDAGVDITATVIADDDIDLARFGIVVRHPMSLLGEAATTNGLNDANAWPQRISPTPLFTGFTTMQHAAGRTLVELTFSEAAETEDHRNWSDPGWKTYSPPLATGPIRLMRGSVRIWTLRLDVATRGSVSADSKPECPAVNLQEVHWRPLPPIGAYIDLRGGFHSVPERLEALRAHTAISFITIRAQAAHMRALDRVLCEAVSVGLPVRVELEVDPNDAPPASSITDQTDAISIFDSDAHSTTSEMFERARSIWPHAEIRGGSSRYFAELNRNPPPHGLSCVTFGVAAQVHNTDARSILNTCDVIPAQVAQAIQDHGVPVAISPLAIRPMTEARTEPDDYRLVLQWLIGALIGSVDAADIALSGLEDPRGSVRAAAEQILPARSQVLVARAAGGLDFIKTSSTTMSRVITSNRSGHDQTVLLPVSSGVEAIAVRAGTTAALIADMP